MNRNKRSAQAHADRVHESVGVTGWIIVRPGGTWYGPYSTRDQAARRIGRRDSLDMRITGVVVHAGPAQ